MGIKAGIFGDQTNFQDRFISDHEKLATLVGYWKGMGLKIVLTSGTFDLLHIGHAEYLEKAKECGDVLVVGLDSDEKVRKRKGPNRPVVSEIERAQILAHLRHVDVIFLKGVNDPNMHLLKTIRPDTLIVSETTGHNDEKIESMKEFCGEVKILKPQSETGTTARVRLLFTEGINKFTEELTKEFPMLIDNLIKKIIHGGEKR